MNSSEEIFKTSSTTFFFASLFFPKDIKERVFDLYAFVRLADNFVDAVPQQPQKYFQFKEAYYKIISGSVASNQLPKNELEVITNFVKLQKEYEFEQSWIDVFFESMEMDLNGHDYQTLADVQKYIYGSADVIGLFMSSIIKLNSKALPYAEKMGSAFQYMNMIRDIAEDLTFNRRYIPYSSLQQFGLNSLEETEARSKPEQFKNLIANEIKQYRIWKQEAEQGFKYIPARYLVAIKTAADMFDDTIRIIENNPFIIYQEKVKPTKFKVMITGLKNIITIYTKPNAIFPTK